MKNRQLLLSSTLAAAILFAIPNVQAADLTTTVQLLTERVDYLEQRLINSDLDNDGYTPAQGDCDDSDATINPATTTPEVGGDGLDNNCDGLIDNVPLSNDADNDGLTDVDELGTYHTDPAKKDTDGDSLAAIGKWENYQCNCTQKCTNWTCTSYTTTCSTCQRWVETAAAVDMGDGVEVFNYGTDPTRKDTDGDGINDGTEIRNKTNPLNSASK